MATPQLGSPIESHDEISNLQRELTQIKNDMRSLQAELATFKIESCKNNISFSLLLRMFMDITGETYINQSYGDLCGWGDISSMIFQLSEAEKIGITIQPWKHSRHGILCAPKMTINLDKQYPSQDETYLYRPQLPQLIGGLLKTIYDKQIIAFQQEKEKEKRKQEAQQYTFDI